VRIAGHGYAARQPMAAHWGIPDPPAAKGSEAQLAAAFLQAMMTFQRRIELFDALVGSGIMAEQLAAEIGALAILNTLPTGAISIVMIQAFVPISGAHFNPGISIAFTPWRDLRGNIVATHVACQLVGAVVGVWAAHLMFALPM